MDFSFPILKSEAGMMMREIPSSLLDKSKLITCKVFPNPISSASSPPRSHLPTFLEQLNRIAGRDKVQHLDQMVGLLR